MDDAVSTCDPVLHELNRMWYVANRKRLTRGRWYVIDGESLAFGPFDTQQHMDWFFEEAGCPCSESAYYVCAGNKDPDSILETYTRCLHLMAEIFSKGQHKKLQFLQDEMQKMLDIMGEHSNHGAVQKDRDWSPMIEVSGDFPNSLVDKCQRAANELSVQLVMPDAPYDQLANSFSTIVTLCNTALESPRTASTAIVITLFKEAACAMRARRRSQKQWPHPLLPLLD